MSRTDDVINVAGHRLSTGLLEEVLASHKRYVSPSLSFLIQLLSYRKAWQNAQ
jgi:hypothetical protein